MYVFCSLSLSLICMCSGSLYIVSLYCVYRPFVCSQALKKIMDRDVRFRHPFSMILAAPSQAGKTMWAIRLIESARSMTTVLPTTIYWCYLEYQAAYETIARLPNVEMIEGLPDLSILRGNSEPKWLILDDMMAEMNKSTSLGTIFTRGVHHWNMSCIFLTQNLFYSNQRNARINANYLVLFKNPSDKLQIANLARQLYPRQVKYFTEAYDDATREPYGYLVVDVTQRTPDELRLRTAIFPDETTVVYCPR